MGSFRSPVGPLPSSVYWRRRLVLLGIPLFVIALVAYACSGTSSTPQNTASPSTENSATPSSTGSIITPAPSETASGPPGYSYPGGSSSAGASGGVGGTGSTGSASAGSTSTSGAGTGSGNGQGVSSGCSLRLSITLDRTSTSGTVQYPAGTYPTFDIEATDEGSANCTVDVSGKGLLVSVMPQGTTKPLWTSEVCSGASDLRVLGPNDTQTYPVVWKRWETQGTTCPVSKLPTVPQGTYTVNAEASGITSSLVTFILN